MFSNATIVRQIVNVSGNGPITTKLMEVMMVPTGQVFSLTVSSKLLQAQILKLRIINHLITMMISALPPL
jgi:hypothetical protein